VLLLRDGNAAAFFHYSGAQREPGEAPVKKSGAKPNKVRPNRVHVRGGKLKIKEGVASDTRGEKLLRGIPEPHGRRQKKSLLVRGGGGLEPVLESCAQGVHVSKK